MADATNGAFRGMTGKDALFKSKAEMKAEKAALKEKKKMEKSKVSSTSCCTTVLTNMLHASTRCGHQHAFHFLISTDSHTKAATLLLVSRQKRFVRARCAVSWPCNPSRTGRSIRHL